MQRCCNNKRTRTQSLKEINPQEAESNRAPFLCWKAPSTRTTLRLHQLTLSSFSNSKSSRRDKRRSKQRKLFAASFPSVDALRPPTECSTYRFQLCEASFGGLMFATAQ
ncbi:hypothetical protein GOP47_0008797 [Adiantum capillus-veneris]|uniref:Uncharacterized protein n=1 Tax=Adiantum capillus-veneris TaxID=13818 RepID=A0A9D4ZK22_ADICA|nr:hypothetical protein GOP47_0008797 [Adiantum capillus-veneris]